MFAPLSPWPMVDYVSLVELMLELKIGESREPVKIYSAIYSFCRAFVTDVVAYI